MRSFSRMTLVILGTMGVTVSSLAGSPVTADQALSLGKKLCAPLIHDKLTSVQWSVYPANAGSNQRVENGSHWLVDGQYYPKMPRGTIGVIDVTVWVPKDGSQPQPCDSVIN